MRLQDRTALVTAAGAGIGRASVRRFAAEGARVVAVDIDGDSLAPLAAEGIAVHRLDVTDAAGVEALAEATGAVDILFNCAGFVDHGTILDCTPDALAFSLELNVTAMYRLIRAFLPAMIAAGGGSIINMASVISATVAAPNRFAYGTSKAAVIGLTRSVAADFAGDGIRCNAICPGAIDTPSLATRLAADSAGYAAARARYIARHPIGRLGRAGEVAALAAYLASEESGFVTGQTIAIDGGWTNL